MLAIQDTTSLNYTAHPATEGLGPIGASGADATLGLEVHSVLMSTLEGTPLGLLDVNAWARDPAEFGQAAARADRPIAKKESSKWLRGYAAADLAAQRLGARTQVVVVGDREADIYELFAAATKGQAEILVRAVQPRKILAPDGGSRAFCGTRCAHRRRRTRSRSRSTAAAPARNGWPKWSCVSARSRSRGHSGASARVRGCAR